jgi:hypothetical protein
VTYTLWVGTNVTENFTINVMARRNSSFYHVMQIAAEQDPHYMWVFESFVLFNAWRCASRIFHLGGAVLFDFKNYVIRIMFK